MDQLATWEMLATYAGAAAAVLLITNVVRYIAQWDARWLGLVVAVTIEALVWFFASDQSISAAALALINAFVVYAAAVGGADMIGSAASRRVRAADADAQPIFFSAWW